MNKCKCGCGQEVKNQGNKYINGHNLSDKVRKLGSDKLRKKQPIQLPDNKYYEHLCACGCGGNIEVKKHHKYQGIPKYIVGHSRNKKGFIIEIPKSKYYKHLCACGCGEKIEVRKSHRSDGIPKYKRGHNEYTEDMRQKLKDTWKKSDRYKGFNLTDIHKEAYKLHGKDKCEICGMTNEDHIKKHKHKNRLSMHCYDKNYKNLKEDNWITVCEFGCHQSLENYSIRHKKNKIL